MTDTTRRRPYSIIEAEADATRRVIEVCQTVAKTALDQRLKLLEWGFPSGHAACEALDEIAAKWSAEVTHQHRALRALIDEACPPVSGAETGDPDDTP